ncbi:hypothetical protein G6F43_005534 [Rhizopus delemar]|nr:hypothetical protein G6F43_005534 [Rhizopus delemar]
MLATTELNESKDSENNVSLQEMSLRHGFQQTQQSHPVNVKHPVAPNTMANHFFLTLDFEKVREDNKMMASQQVDKEDMGEKKKEKRRNRKRKERGIEEEEEETEKKKVLAKKDKEIG